MLARIYKAIGVCVLLMAGAFYAGCSGSGGASKEYSFESSDTSYTIIHQEGDKLIVKAGGKELDSAVLLVFLTQDCAECEAYYEHLNHLQASEKDFKILGVFDSKLSDKTMLKEFAQTHNITFPLLHSTSSNSLLESLLQTKRMRVNGLLQSGAQDSGMKDSAPESSESKDSVAGSTQEPSPESSAQSIGDVVAPVVDFGVTLPYFVLYDNEHLFYQDYEGIVPEEIFSSDIAQILQ